MTNEQKQVKEFMQLFGQETPSKPCIPDEAICLLRAKLIYEEAIETCLALGWYPSYPQDQLGVRWDKTKSKPNLKEIADGLADLHYVAYCGTAVACGLGMEPIFAEVHRSNMSKLWSEDDIEQKLYNPPDTRGEWYDANHQQMFITKMDDGMYLVRNKDGKVIKSPSYSPANIQAEIDKQLLCPASPNSK